MMLCFGNNPANERHERTDQPTNNHARSQYLLAGVKINLHSAAVPWIHRLVRQVSIKINPSRDLVCNMSFVRLAGRAGRCWYMISLSIEMSGSQQTAARHQTIAEHPAHRC